MLNLVPLLRTDQIPGYTRVFTQGEGVTTVIQLTKSETASAFSLIMANVSGCSVHALSRLIHHLLAQPPSLHRSQTLIPMTALNKGLQPLWDERFTSSTRSVGPAFATPPYSQRAPRALKPLGWTEPRPESRSHPAPPPRALPHKGGLATTTATGHPQQISGSKLAGPRLAPTHRREPGPTRGAAPGHP